jgi:pimeloyl-ACP methyl ester carboxylesterase
MPAAEIPTKTVKLSWILSAFALMVAVAAVCAYLSLCLFFYQGQWQLLFHASTTVSLTPANAGLPFEAVRFDTPETGVPRLSGWWIAADANPASNCSTWNKRRNPVITVLYLHGGTGSLADTLPALARLHALGLTIFAIDYRGYGQSAPLHPSEQSMLSDTDAALAYLVDLRHLAPTSIVLYGEGTGATIAAEAASRHPEIRKIILENLNPPALETLSADPRTARLPVRLLMTSPLDPSSALRSTGPARLFIGPDRNTAAAFQQAPQPKSRNATPDSASLCSFLEQKH